jgi:uncharacterized protein YaeQ
VSARHAFSFVSQEARRPLPSRLIIAQHETETIAHIALKLLAHLYFARDRLQLETNLHDDSIPFIPDLVQLDYELRPALWVECGECSVAKLNKLAVKVPEAAIWIVKKSPADADSLVRAMEREELRRDRYSLLVFDPEVFQEVCAALRPRNDVVWFGTTEEPAAMQFELNELWYELPFEVRSF